MASVIPDPSGGSRRHAALVSLPRQKRSAARELAVRAGVGLLLLTITSLIVFLDRGAYSDNVNNDGVSLIDAVYYSTVTVTTTGYGDITPVAPHARIINAIVITPMRIVFLVLLVGTTLEVLANEGRRALLDNHWRKRMRSHVIIIGYGTKGRNAVATLAQHGHNMEKVVAIDGGTTPIADANLDGIAAIQGDATRRDILKRAEISKARDIIITLDRDDSAILVTLTARQLNPSAHIVVSVREQQNVSLLRQSGADSVVTSSAAVGRLLGLSAVSPNIGTAIEDLLTSGQGLEVSERRVEPDEVGKSPGEISHERVIGVVRHKTMRRFYDSTCQTLETGDQLIVVRKSDQDKNHHRNERDSLERFDRHLNDD